MMCALWLLGFAAHAAAFDPSQAVELHQGPVIGAANILGMGGAHIGVAETSAGQLFNPAAVANRSGKNGGAWFDWDFSLDGASAGAVGAVAVDVDPPGPGVTLAQQTTIATGTFALNFGRLGVGLTVDNVDYAFCLTGQSACGAASTTRYNAGTVGLLGGYAFDEGTWVVALGLGTAVTTFYLPATPARTFGGIHGLGGVLFRPPWGNLRVGATLRTGTTLDPTFATPGFGGVLLPSHTTFPWQFGVGAAWGFGERPLNPPPTYGEPGYRGAAPPTGWFRDARVAFDVLLEGPSHAAVSIVSWAGQEQRAAGRDATFTLRLGAESEFWPDRVRVRAGTYFEPARSVGVHGRVHGTGGLEVRLGRLIWNWKVGAAGDFAPRYVNTVVSLGFW